jgi:hypothetical protein
MSDPIYRNQGDGPYLWLSKDAQDRALEAAGSKGLATYIALCRLESNAPQAYKSRFSASRFNIAQFSGLSVRTIAEILPVLVRARLISFQSGRHVGIKRSHEANKFTLLRIGSGDAENNQAPYANPTGETCPQKRTFFPKGKRKVLEQPSSSARKPKGSGFTTAASTTVPTFKG